MVKWTRLFKNIPNKIKVGKNTYEVLWIKEFIRFSDQYGESRFGEDKQIVLNINQDKKEAVHTLFHEFIHAISFEYNSNLTEKQVQSIEKSLKDFINLIIILNEGNSSNVPEEKFRSKVVRKTRKTIKKRTYKK